MRVRFTVAYDGRGFLGFAENAGVRTVGGDLAAALRRVLRSTDPVAITVAGRT
ncbi:MAG: tRNA pseudouridine(38-40) synthase TruA, partial [Actinobacteria bacterium]|nr:tRNA pseudouridine(38-40) synthase TruA [Actinomycetota bacterium]